MFFIKRADDAPYLFTVRGTASDTDAITHAGANTGTDAHANANANA